jgi:hypothetical protein
MILCSECKIEFNSNRSLSNHLRGGCKTNRKYEKICDCGEILTYRSPKEFKMAIDNDSKCIKCCSKITKHSDDTKLKISNRLKSLYENGEITPNMSGAHSEEARRKMSETKKGKNLTEDHKNKIKESIINSELHKLSTKNPDRNKKISDKHKGKTISNETKIKMSENHADISGDKNPSKRPDVRKKLRLKTIEKLESDLELYGKKIIPFFNNKGCEYFNKLMLENNTFIQHALNGGEFYIKELGYWVDGYDRENNMVYEWDEKYHYDVYGNLLEKDVIRQKEIEDYLKCRFIRIKQNY